MRAAAFAFAVIACCSSVAYAQNNVISVVQTAANTTDRLTPKASLSFGPDFPAAITVSLDPTQTYQSIIGFGGALTEAATYTIAQLQPSLVSEILEAYYGASGHQYTLGRIPMGSCDFSVSSYCFDDTPGDYQLTNFDMNVTRDQQTIIPFVLRAQSLVASNGGALRLFATPWTPTAWMKSNNNLNGSNVPGMILDARTQSAWALYFSKYLSAYANAGIEFWGVTVQNEPEYAPVYEGCVYSAEQERDFIAGYLGPRLRADHPNVNIMIYDHNKDDVFKWAQVVLGDPNAAQYIAGTAVHWYSGDQFEHLSQTNVAFPDKFILASEACTCPPSSDWSNGESYGHDIIGDLQHWATGWTDWNIVLNPEGGPNHVSNFCNAPIIADTNAQTLTYQPAYWYMGHFSRFLPPGSARINVTSTDSDVQVTAFIQPSV